ncbi:hypothetical protein AB0G82_12735 [Streptomyces anulatus]
MRYGGRAERISAQWAQDTVTACSNASGTGVRRLAGRLNTFAVLNRGVRQ